MGCEFRKAVRMVGRGEGEGCVEESSVQNNTLV